MASYSPSSLLIAHHHHHHPSFSAASAISCFAHLASSTLSLLPNKPCMWRGQNCLQKQAGKRVASVVAAGMLQQVANTEIPTRDGTKIQAFVSIPPSNPISESQSAPEKLPLLILIHEFYGLTPEICGRKAEAIAKEVGCAVIAPDTYRGESTRFVPKAIFLALTTPQERVNKDLDEVLAWASTLPQVNIDKVGLAGFCYGGGKALEYSIYYKKAKAVIVIYGKPVLDVESLKSIGGSVLGVFGDQDAQFPLKMIMDFEEALEKAEIWKKIIISKGQGHAFWKDMDQVIRGNQPQKEVWIEVTNFLRNTLFT
ncbi:hypothetical protein O6H91_Y440200 [Diphasiastrum complanatum]|nr:hypothetical protein O6H91_Y440200 [Diphasiastrum complanatum]